MMKHYQCLALGLLGLITACSDEQDKTVVEAPAQEHIFQAQADALEKAKGVEQMIQNAADQQRLKIDQQTY
ncbi:MAG: hypothetical protein V7752_09225 [Halopseudomonas sp.]